jgi:hypothetical protein
VVNKRLRIVTFLDEPCNSSLAAGEQHGRPAWLQLLGRRSAPEFQIRYTVSAE